MPEYRFPEQNTVIPPTPSTSDTLYRCIENVFSADKPFTGYLKVTGNKNIFYFFFFLQGEGYAAGKFVDDKPFSIQISAFFDDTAKLDDAKMSLHQSDPVLLKSFLIFLQNEPAIKAPVNLIDLEYIVRKIFDEAGDAMIVLEKSRMFNFFFIKNGKTAHPHMADTAWSAADNLTFDERILLYAFEHAAEPVTVYVYRKVDTNHAADVSQAWREKLLAVAKSPGTALPDEVEAPQERTQEQDFNSVTLEIVSGPQKGTRLTASIPCKIGRKDCDLIINDPQVSRRHAQIVVVDGKFMIEDFESTNGTFVNGAATKSAVLSPSDVVSIGQTQFKMVQ